MYGCVNKSCTAARHSTSIKAPANKTPSYEMENTQFTLDMLVCVSCLFSRAWAEPLPMRILKNIEHPTVKRAESESRIDQRYLTFLMISYAWQAVLAILACFRIATQHLSQTYICLQIAKHTSSKTLHTCATCVEDLCQTYVFQKLAP